MPRRTRGEILYDGCYAHVYSRSIHQQFVFCDEDDFTRFKQLLLDSKERHAYRLHHYCLMHTHFHMVVSIPCLTAFSKALKELKQNHALGFHEKYRKAGPVWWGRFGSQLIENEKYLYACGLYVEQNPVKAGLVTHAEAWAHSSAKYYFLGCQDDLVDNYEKPALEKGLELTEGLNVGKGPYIGSPLFMMQ